MCEDRTEGDGNAMGEGTWLNACETASAIDIRLNGGCWTVSTLETDIELGNEASAGSPWTAMKSGFDPGSSFTTGADCRLAGESSLRSLGLG